MKKIIAVVVCVLMLATVFAGCAPAPAASSAPAEAPAESAKAPAADASKPAEAGKEITIGYYKDAADDYYKAGYEVFQALIAADPETAGWKIIDKVGEGTAAEQISAVEDFITTGVDAIVIVQNSPEASSECIAKANAAGIPYFAATHKPKIKDGQEIASMVAYNFVEAGEMAGKSAMAHNVNKLILIEGKLGQGGAAEQTDGFIKAYADAGKDVGTLWDKEAKKANLDGKGGKDLEIVFKGSGGWFADPAKKAVTDAITSLGKDGFNGAYIQNDEMMDGGIQAIEEAGLNPADYWLGSSNGKEKSWKWADEGKVTMDVNQTPTLEADYMYQIVKDYFGAKELKNTKVFATLKPFEKGQTTGLIPYDKDLYMKGRAAGDWDYDVKNAEVMGAEWYSEGVSAAAADAAAK
ncbi:MAG: sugar ABC transporter substrate-binding protein [Christensenella sp.]